MRPLPSAFITATCSTSLVPAVPTRKATREPSGDHEACASSTPGVAVSACSEDPSGRTVSRSRPLEKTTRPSPPANDPAPGAAASEPRTTIVETSARRMATGYAAMSRATPYRSSG